MVQAVNTAFKHASFISTHLAHSVNAKRAETRGKNSVWSSPGSGWAHLIFVENIIARQRPEKRKLVAMVCLYDFALNDFA